MGLNTKKFNAVRGLIHERAEGGAVEVAIPVPEPELPRADSERYPNQRALTYAQQAQVAEMEGKPLKRTWYSIKEAWTRTWA